MNERFETDQQRILDKIKEAKRIRRGLMANLGESVYQIVRTDPNLRTGHEDIIDGIVACEAAVEHLEDRLAALEARMYAEQAEASLSIVADNVETEPILEEGEFATEQEPEQEPEEETETVSEETAAEPTEAAEAQEEAVESPYEAFSVTIEPEIEDDHDEAAPVVQDEAAPVVEEPAKVESSDDEDDGFFDEVAADKGVEAEEAPEAETETKAEAVEPEPEPVEEGEETVEEKGSADDASASFTFTIDTDIEGQDEATEVPADQVDEFADLDATGVIEESSATVEDAAETPIAEATVEGATDPMLCPHCGSPIEGSFKFCIACGKPLE